MLTSEEESYEAGDVIFEEGSHGTAVYVLHSGKVEISKIVQGTKIVLEILAPGDIFGEMSFIDPAPRSATAIAVEDTVLQLVDKDFLDREFNQISSDFREVLCNLVRRLRKTIPGVGYFPRPREETAGAREDRVSTNIRISFKKARDFFRAYTANIGSGGLFVRTTKNLPEGSLLNLEFNLPNSNHVIHTKGKVAWARSKEASSEQMPPGMGIAFVDIRAEDKKLVNNYIALLKSS
jgi:uncharacterized protein (TIGR02266 family)